MPRPCLSADTYRYIPLSDVAEVMKGILVNATGIQRGRANRQGTDPGIIKPVFHVECQERGNFVGMAFAFDTSQRGSQKLGLEEWDKCADACQGIAKRLEAHLANIDLYQQVSFDEESKRCHVVCDRVALARVISILEDEEFYNSWNGYRKNGVYQLNSPLASDFNVRLHHQGYLRVAASGIEKKILGDYVDRTEDAPLPRFSVVCRPHGRLDRLSICLDMQDGQIWNLTAKRSDAFQIACHRAIEALCTHHGITKVTSLQPGCFLAVEGLQQDLLNAMNSVRQAEQPQSGVVARGSPLSLRKPISF